MLTLITLIGNLSDHSKVTEYYDIVTSKLISNGNIHDKNADE